MSAIDYEKLKKFQRIDFTLKKSDEKKSIYVFENETIQKITQNLFFYQQQEKERLRKLEALTQLLLRLETK